MALTSNEAIGYCIKIGSDFLYFYKGLDSLKTEKMQHLYDVVSNIVIKGQDHKINTHHIYDWFLLQGSSLDLLFDNEEDALRYKSFAYALLDNDNGDVLEALKEVGLC